MVFSDEYRVFRELLRDQRVAKGVTQAALSSALEMPQSFVSKYEVGERRLDFVEVTKICKELGISTASFVKQYEAALASVTGVTTSKKRTKSV